MTRKYRKFDDDFKQGAVALVTETGRPIAQVVFRFCQLLGILPLTGTSQLEHMQLDLAASELELSSAQLSALESLHAY